MCDELGNEEYMTAYVEEYGNTTLCSLEDGFAGCTEKEIGYIKKMKEKDLSEVKKQFERLEGMDTKAMKAELGDWVNKRKKILSKLMEKQSIQAEL